MRLIMKDKWMLMSLQRTKACLMGCLIGCCALLCRAADDFVIPLDSSDGSSAFRILDGATNAILTVRSDAVSVFSTNSRLAITEADPVFTNSAARSIEATDIAHWRESYGWGNHAAAGYATGIPLYVETDSTWTTVKDAYATTNWVEQSRLHEAPSNGIAYGRQNGEWVVDAGGTPRQVWSNFTLTVGSGGDFASMNEAIAFAVTNYHHTYKSTGSITCEVQLLSGYVVTEQVIAVDTDLGWIHITAQDASVPVTRSCITNSVGVGYPPVFGAVRGATPTIHALFGLSGGSANVNGLTAAYGSRATIVTNGGFTNATYGVLAIYGSSIIANGAIATRSHAYGFVAQDGSRMQAQYANASYSSNAGFTAISSSRVDAQYARASNIVGGYGFYAQFASAINAYYATASSSYYGLYVYNGSKINGYGAQAKSCTYGVLASDASSVNATLMDTGGAVQKGFYIQQGSMITAIWTTGTFARATNTLSAAGVIYYVK